MRDEMRMCQIRRDAKMITLFILITLAITGIESAIAQKPSSRVKHLSIQVYREGFIQKELHLQAGDYSFSFLNHSGKEELEFQLERMPGASLADAPVDKVFSKSNDTRTLLMSQKVSLTPGTYRLVVTNRANWICALVVK
jgi:hypothetical protein